MFSIVWLRNEAELGREQCGLKEADEVVRYARAKVKMGHTHLGGSTPDEFRVMDDSGHEIARQQISDSHYA